MLIFGLPVETFVLVFSQVLQLHPLGTFGRRTFMRLIIPNDFLNFAVPDSTMLWITNHEDFARGTFLKFNYALFAQQMAISTLKNGRK